MNEMVRAKHEAERRIRLRFDAFYARFLKCSECGAYHGTDVVNTSCTRCFAPLLPAGYTRAPHKTPTRETMCMSVAPGRIAVCVPPDQDGSMRTPWCHLEKGHSGPCVCGEFRWSM